jgi:hypothetical protein
MKKFFQGGLESPRTPGSSNGYSHTVPIPGFLAAPLVAASSPLSPQSISSHQQYFDLQRTATISPSPSSTMQFDSGILASLIPPSPALTNQTFDSNIGIQGHTIERTEMHKGLKSLETLLATLDEYRDLKNRIAKSEKRLAKNLAELSKSKMLEDVPSQTLQASASLFDSITDTTSKHAKLVQKEYDSLNEHCGKYFKKVAKEERAHEELLDTLDSKVKRAHVGHEKNAKRSGRIAIESHDKYIQTVQGLTQEISKAKASHNASIGNKTHITSLVVASTLGGIGDAEFKALCESVRKSGQHVGKLNEWLNFASMEGMTNVQPIDLNEDAMGWAQVLAKKEAEIREELNRQEQAKLAQLEQAQAYLKAQQVQRMMSGLQTRQPEPISPVVQPAMSISNNMPTLDIMGCERPSGARTVAMAGSKQHHLTPISIASGPQSKEDAFKQNEDTHSMQSSLAEGTIIDRGDATIEPVKQSSPLSSPMKSTSSRDSSDGTHSKDSDNSGTLSVDRSTTPSTPKDDLPSRDIFMKATERGNEIVKRADVHQVAEMKVERPADRYIDVGANKPEAAQSRPAVQRRDTEEDKYRRHSMWSQGKERERQMEREAELARRLMEADNRQRIADRESQAKINSYRLDFKPRLSEPTLRRQSFVNDKEIPAQRYEPDRYAPAVAGVNRNQSTDSERSFVAKMKAKYQEEKLNASPNAPTYIRSGGGGANKIFAAVALPPIARRNSTAARLAEDPKMAHATSCECWSCFARHNSNPPSQSQQSYMQPQKRSSQRRQTITLIPDIPSLATLSPPHQPREVVPRRSFEAEPNRRTVMFADDFPMIK